MNTCTTNGTCEKSHACAAKLLLRILLGYIFIAAGGSKLLMGAGVTGMFESMGIAGWLGYVVALVELVAGIFILIGYKTKAAAYSIVVIMLGAIALVTAPAAMETGSMADVTHLNYTIAVTVVAIAIALLGPGNHSVQRCLSEKRASAHSATTTSEPQTEN